MDIIPAHRAASMKLPRPVIKRHKIEGGRGETYPYDDWADGQWRIATRGVDFDIKPESFVVTLHQWARRNGGVHISARRQGDQVYFQLGPLTPEQQHERRFYVHPSEIRR